MNSQDCVQQSSTEHAEVQQHSKIGEERSRDYTNEFTTYQVFESKAALIRWVHTTGKRNNCVIVIQRSNLGNSGNKRRPRIKFSCERGGKFRKFKGITKMVDKRTQNSEVDGNKADEQQRSRLTSTKKCECPFLLKAFNIGSDEWVLEVACGIHNHVAPSYLEGHSYAGRLCEEEHELLVDMSKRLMRPKDILTTIKSRDPSNTSTMRTIYNARYFARIIARAGRTQMQQLLKNLRDHHYIEYHRSENHMVTDLFWCHSFSLQMLRTFPHVLIMDCTYKTNRYRFPLFEIVGITSTEQTFNVAFVYMSKETEDNYRWALSMLRTLMDEDFMPGVIVTDRELALMKATENVFPDTHQILCKWHISKNVLRKCKGKFKTKEGWEAFNNDWHSLVDCSTEDEYLHSLAAFESKYSALTEEINYLKTNWLNKYKEMFIAAWTNNYLHLGARTSNRAESAHAKLKRELRSSQLDFCVSWESRCFVQHEFDHAYLRELIGFVSIPALQKIVHEANKADDIVSDLASCNCAVRKTHGLPCAHEIAAYKRSDSPLPTTCVHHHWRKLDIGATVEDSNVHEKIPLKAQLERLAEWAEEQNDDTRRQILVKIDELINPSSTVLREPAEKRKTKGRPSKEDNSTRRLPSGFEITNTVLSERETQSPLSDVQKVSRKSNTNSSNDHLEKSKALSQVDKHAQKDTRFELTQKYTVQFIFGMRQYIIGSMDVENDGNCGFRVVASAMGFGRKHWRKVRTDLVNELKGTPELYEALYGGQDAVNKLCKRLNHSASNFAPKWKWMDLPDMGHLIATCYGVVVVNLSYGQCSTFLPLREYTEGKLMEANLLEIGLGFVNDDHFVQICLLSGHPLPPVTPDWIYHADDKAKSLYMKYQDRFQHYDRLPHPERVTNMSLETVQVDDDNVLVNEIVRLDDVDSEGERMQFDDD